MDTTFLEEIGLTRSEARVYLALAVLGPSSTGPIVRKASIASSKIYEALGRLEAKGLVSDATQSGVRIFEAASPERIIAYLTEKERRIETEKVKAERFVRQLAAALPRRASQEAAIFRGMKGLRTIFYDCIRTMKPGSTVLAMGVPPRSAAANRFFVHWNRFRAKNKVKLKIVFNESARGEPQTREENSPLATIRFMPEDIIMPAAINIFDDRVVIFPHESGDDPLLVCIRSTAIADSFRAQFGLLWNQNVRTFSGEEGPRFVLRDIIRTGKPVRAFGLTREKYEQHVPDAITAFTADVEREKLREHLIVTGHTITKKSRHTLVRRLPQRFATPFHYELYGTKVACFYWIDPIITTVIDDAAVAARFRRHFVHMWRLAEPA